MLMRKIIHLILIVLLLVPCSALQASHQPEFSTAGFFELPNSGREVFSMNPAWRFYKGSVAGAEAISFDDTEWAVVSLPNGIEYLPTEASGCINYQGEVWYRKHFTPADALKGKDDAGHFHRRDRGNASPPRAGERGRADGHAAKRPADGNAAGNGDHAAAAGRKGAGARLPARRAGADVRRQIHGAVPARLAGKDGHRLRQGFRARAGMDGLHRRGREDHQAPAGRGLRLPAGRQARSDRS